jgi:hypothetical protein
MRLVIINSGGANIASLRFAFERLGCRAELSADPGTVRDATHVVLPGVGAAADAMARLDRHGLAEVIPSLRQPVLGICLGMQLLFDHSEEGSTNCLGAIAGNAEGDVEQAGNARDPVAPDGSAIGTRRDVIEDELVRAAVAVAPGELDDVADDAMLAKAHALDHLAGAHVEAGNYAFGKNGLSSSIGMSSSSNARPLTAAATPSRSRAARSAAQRMPPDACHAIRG